MKALILKEHGGLDNLELVNDKPLPVAGEGEVLVRVKASAFNYHDVFTVQGLPGIRIPLPVVIGLDMASLKKMPVNGRRATVFWSIRYVPVSA